MLKTVRQIFFFFERNFVSLHHQRQHFHALANLGDVVNCKKISIFAPSKTTDYVEMAVCQLHAKKLQNKKMESLIIGNPAIVRDFFRTTPTVMGYLYP